MGTIHNVSLLTASNYFSSTAAQLPLDMFSERELAGNGSFYQGRTRNDGLFGSITSDLNHSEVEFSKSAVHNALPRMNDELETVQAWDFTDNNMSTDRIDGNQDYTNRQLINAKYENAFKIPASTLNEVNRYKYIYKESLVTTLHTYEQANSNGKGTGYYSSIYVNMPVAPSLFNPFLAINALGPMENVPLINDNSYYKIQVNEYKTNSSDDTKMEKSNTQKEYVVWKQEDVSDCSIKTLVALSKIDEVGKSSKLGMARYKWADFMYCKDLGKYSNNMLITLRKFPHPIGDNIFNKYGFAEDANDAELDMSPDIGRMVAWLGTDNKLEDIVRFSTKETWKELDAEDEEQQSREDTTRLGALFSIGSPKYMQSFAGGTIGSANSILGSFAGNGGILNNKGQYEDNPAMNGSHYDPHKVYTPRGTVQKTHIYEGKLEFTHSFKLVFDYELRAYENINPKAAFLDLLGNVLATCYRKGTFWGGAHRLLGAPGMGAASGWKLANEFIDGTAELGGGLLTNLLSGGKHGTSTKDAANKINGAVGEGKDLLGQAWNALTNGGAIKIGQIFTQGLSGLLKNGLGRPQIYAFHALLSGEPVGLWHVTIGNPRNPILAMGNLIIESTDYQFYGPLGIDDFPTGLKVTVNLMHAKPRDAAEIANMFTKGQTTINVNLIGGGSKNAIHQFVNLDPSIDDKGNLLNPNNYSDSSRKDNYNLYGTSNGNKLTSVFASAGS